MCSHLVEPTIFSRLEDTEEEKTAKAYRPEHDKDRGEDVAGDKVGLIAEKESEKGEKEEVDGSAKVGPVEKEGQSLASVQASLTHSLSVCRVKEMRKREP